jgi:hypothetical protein
MGSDINLEDLNDLEDELNNLSSEIKPMKVKSKSSLFNQALNGSGDRDRDDSIKLNFKNDDDNKNSRRKPCRDGI